MKRIFSIIVVLLFCVLVLMQCSGSSKPARPGQPVRTVEDVDQDQDTYSIDFSVSKCVLASRLNLTQEHFSRLLHDLSELGLIRVTGRRLTIPSLMRLSAHQFK